jgi:hypothetical protein
MAQINYYNDEAAYNADAIATQISLQYPILKDL